MSLDLAASSALPGCARRRIQSGKRRANDLDTRFRLTIAAPGGPIPAPDATVRLTGRATPSPERVGRRLARTVRLGSSAVVRHGCRSRRCRGGLPRLRAMPPAPSKPDCCCALTRRLVCSICRTPEMRSATSSAWHLAKRPPAGGRPPCHRTAPDGHCSPQGPRTSRHTAGPGSLSCGRSPSPVPEDRPGRPLT